MDTAKPETFTVPDVKTATPSQVTKESLHKDHQPLYNLMLMDMIRQELLSACDDAAPDPRNPDNRSLYPFLSDIENRLDKPLERMRATVEEGESEHKLWGDLNRDFDERCTRAFSRLGNIPAGMVKYRGEEFERGFDSFLESGGISLKSDYDTVAAKVREFISTW